MNRRFKRWLTFNNWPRFWHQVRTYSITAAFAICGALLGAIIGTSIVRYFQEPKQPQYIVVEYAPECDCYRVVDVIETMKGIEDNE